MNLQDIIPPEHKNFSPILFFGRVLPEYPALEMSEPLLLEFNGDDGTIMYGSFRIIRSLIQIEVRTNSTEIETVSNYADEQIRIILDSYCFCTGHTFDSEIQVAVLEDGKQMVFNNGHPTLQLLSEHQRLKPIEVLLLCSNQPLRYALADYREAINVPIETGFFCYRAVETIMQFFKSWEEMHKALNTTKEFIVKDMKSNADTRRHGSVDVISSKERDFLLVSTSEIIDRYCRYLSSDCQPLDQGEFPSMNRNLVESVLRKIGKR